MLCADSLHVGFRLLFLSSYWAVHTCLWCSSCSLVCQMHPQRNGKNTRTTTNRLLTLPILPLHVVLLFFLQSDGAKRILSKAFHPFVFYGQIHPESWAGCATKDSPVSYPLGFKHPGVLHASVQPQQLHIAWNPDSKDIRENILSCLHLSSRPEFTTLSKSLQFHSLAWSVISFSPLGTPALCLCSQHA